MSPEFEWSWVWALIPEISLVILLFIVLLYDRWLEPHERRKVGALTAWGGFVILLATVGLWFFFDEPNINNTLNESLIWGGMIRHDLVTLVFRVIFLIALILTSLVSMDTERLQRSEFYGLLIAATIGFSLMAAGSDLIMIYIALETASISSYVLAGFVTGSKRSSEAGMKYFVYGAFATGLMLYGMSFLYGLTGQTNIYRIPQEIAALLANVSTDTVPAGNIGGITPLIVLSAALIVAGFGFKISMFPFHFWTPDVYEGAPTSFTAFVSTASKAAGFAVLIRVFTSGMFGDVNNFSAETAPVWWWAMVVLCIVTMTVGNLGAIFQTNVKRMLAYSSIAQAGYALIGLLTFTEDGSGATLFYLLMYIFTNIAAFGVIIVVSNVTHSDEVKDLNGLSRRSPYLALVMLFALLSLGGIPPTAGFFGKFFLFKSAVDVGLWWLALIGVLNAFVALYYYLSLVRNMYLYRSDEEDIGIPVSRAVALGLGISLFFILYLGVYAGPAFEWTRQAASAFFTG